MPPTERVPDDEEAEACETAGAGAETALFSTTGAAGCVAVFTTGCAAGFTVGCAATCAAGLLSATAVFGAVYPAGLTFTT